MRKKRKSKNTNWRPADPSGQITLFDGRTGEQFERPVTVGYMRMLKLEPPGWHKMYALFYRFLQPATSNRWVVQQRASRQRWGDGSVGAEATAPPHPAKCFTVAP